MMLDITDVVFDKTKAGMPIQIGRGATGIVYRGHLGKQPVAIKQETVDKADEEVWLKTARLHHAAVCPNVVVMHGVIIDRDEEATTHYIVMERLAGSMTTLLLTPGGVHYGADTKLRLRLLADVASGLAYLHKHTVIHADVKPDNVLLTAVNEDSPTPVAKLADFGGSLMRGVGSATRTTHKGAQGTWVYMDPCLIANTGSITTACDVYSFATTAWHVLTGIVPYETELAAEVVAATSSLQALDALRRHVVTEGKRPPVSALVERGVPPSIVSLLESCWAAVPSARPAMADVHRELERVLAPPPPPPPPVPLPLLADTLALAYKWKDALALRGHRAGVRALVLLPDGSVASGDSRGVVRLYGAARDDGTPTEVTGHGGQVRGLAVLPDGRLVAGVWSAAGAKGAVVVWAAASAAAVAGGAAAAAAAALKPSIDKRIDCGSGVEAVVALCDGRIVAGCADGRLRMVDAATSSVTIARDAHRAAVTALVVLLDGRLASASRDATVALWSAAATAADAAPDARLTEHRSAVLALAVLRGSDSVGLLASGSADATVRVWNVATGACVSTLTTGGPLDVFALAPLPDGGLVAGLYDGRINVWKTPTASSGAPSESWPAHTASVLALAPLPGGRFASGADDTTVRLWAVPAH